MTLEEKVAQLIHVWGSVKDDDVLRTYGNTSVGAMYSAGLSANDTCNAIVRCRTQVRELNHTSVESLFALGQLREDVSRHIDNVLRAISCNVASDCVN